MLATALTPAMAQEGRLVLYTSQPQTDAQQTADAFMEQYPDITVEWVRDGTTQIMARFRSELEAGTPQADVLLIADVVTMEGLKAEGLLLNYPEADVSAYPEGLHDEDGAYFSTKLITTGIVYNTAATMIPESWYDLTKPEAQGQIAMPSPLTSGAALIHTVTLTENLPEGWDFYTALAENGAQASGGNGGVLTAVSGGEKLYGMIVDYMPIREAANGAPVEFVFPTEGVSAVTEPAAILASSQNQENAKLFIDFLLSEEGQELAVSQGYIPARDGMALPEGYPDRSEINVLNYDAANALANEQANRDRFGEIFGQ
ncbi:ABC transporter substrate-binding protein [Pelagibacterium sp. 26DY04]|nr:MULTISPECIES: ABC transporter substrate-binding protein [unclassified Pelagibacterium]WMT88830.1 ABC transporter substrate-binding protein [Pelagibacterium sp. 26DY04]WMT92385.1 ABC transporter substrate-binding protein [Pelagibacterium sp. H642]